MQVEGVDPGELGVRARVAERRARPLGPGWRDRGEEEDSGEQALPRAAAFAAGQEFGRGQAQADQECGGGDAVREEEGQGVEVDRGCEAHESTVGGLGAGGEEGKRGLWTTGGGVENLGE
ncbi:hypothetical protein CNX65_28335 [Actinosynnema pretiosum]|uniref:Uncharacterized protein n=1 Tax=Actinosynnema pretiosum TaxID=42197 RepID=A0A290ZCE5_9PSEU|nr:hypothetical protein CNX65_28335 [Actinosynnema pretiosum]